MKKQTGKIDTSKMEEVKAPVYWTQEPKTAADILLEIAENQPRFIEYILKEKN